MYPVLSFAFFFVFSPKILEHKQVALPISMYKHLSCAAYKIKLASGSGNAGRCEKFRDRSRIRLRPKAGVYASGLGVHTRTDATIWIRDRGDVSAKVFLAQKRDPWAAVV